MWVEQLESRGSIDSTQFASTLTQLEAVGQLFRCVHWFFDFSRRVMDVSTAIVAASQVTAQRNELLDKGEQVRPSQHNASSG